MTTFQAPSSAPVHPVAGAVAAVRAALSGVAGSPAWGLSAEELCSTLRDLDAARAQLDELTLRLVAQADRDDLGHTHGARDTATWWADQTCQDRGPARARTALGRALDTGHDLTREAMSRGEVSEAQARVVVEACTALPDRIETEVVNRCEKELLARAEQLTPRELRVLGKRVLDLVAPEVAEAEEARQLAAEERHAAETVRFSMHDDGHGTCHGTFRIASHHGAMLRTYLLALNAPAVRSQRDLPTIAGPGAGPRMLGEAFTALVERYTPSDLPQAGGVAATMTVTLDHATLLDQLGAAAVVETDTGVRITAGEARRMACTAGILPVVLGERSAVLDLGRTARFHTKAQRIAIALRDKTCTAEGCDWPPGMCEVHHDHPWSKGGRTCVEEGRLLCRRHHQMAHDPGFAMIKSKHGRVVFRRT